MSKADDPAFPTDANIDQWGSRGLTKRELFAAMAMAGDLAENTPFKGELPRAAAGWVAGADALIEALEKSK